MVDFNWYRASGTDEDWRIRAERLKAEIDANKFWYRVITQAAPRYASHDDATRVCEFLNRRMRATRVMEHELEWLEQSITPQEESVELITAEADARAMEASARERESRRKWRKTGLISVACLLAQGPARATLEESAVGTIVLVATLMKLCHVAFESLVAARGWIAALFYDARRMRELRQLSEREVINWHRALRLEEHMCLTQDRARSGKA